MTDYKTGRNSDFFWIEFPGNSFSLHDFLNHCSDILKNKYLAIICFDSGTLGLVNEEKDSGWYEKGRIAYSPKLTDSSIAALPTEQHDQWCLFNTPTEFPAMTDFVNYGNFTLASRRQELVNADPTWDKVGLERQIEFHEQLVEQFWNEILTINPMLYIADGDNFIFVTKTIKDINNLKHNCR